MRIKSGEMTWKEGTRMRPLFLFAPALPNPAVSRILIAHGRLDESSYRSHQALCIRQPHRHLSGVLTRAIAVDPDVLQAEFAGRGDVVEPAARDVHPVGYSHARFSEEPAKVAE